MIINIIIDPSDNYSARESDNTIDLNNQDEFSYTFWAIKDRFPAWYNTKALDLMYISMAVFAADRKVLRLDAIDGWRREFTLHIPVMNYELFRDNTELICSMLNYLTGDNWHFIWRPRELNEQELRHRDRKHRKDRPEKSYNKVCMFSGGMDSFIGAIDLLETVGDDILFVSHYGGGKGVKEYQDRLISQFTNKYSLERRDFIQFHAKAINGVEDTTRSRSFMFFSHAVAFASAMQKPIDIIVPENGLISLNIPLTFSRIGSSSTRTTHPYYMKMLQQLLDNLGLKVRFLNPYQFKTKGEMLLECKNQAFMKTNIINTMSCSHPDVGRNRGEKATMHCGYCLPCVIRQAAMKRAGLTDDTSYYDSKFQNVKEAGRIHNSYNLGLHHFDPLYAFMAIQQNGRIDHNNTDFEDLYIRGMNELKNYLDEIE